MKEGDWIMGFKVSFREYKLSFDFGNVLIKAIDANHGVFIHSFPRHMHSFYELHYIVNGEGRLILDDAEYGLSKGQLFLLAPKVHHAQLTNTNNCMEEYFFSFEVQPKKTKTDCLISEFLTESDFYICEDTRGIEKIFSELEYEMNHCEMGFIAAAQSLLEHILLLTARNFLCKSSAKPDVRNVPDDRRSLLMDEAFLYSHKTITLENLAEILNLSPRHTERLIYEKYGTSFVKLRLQVRMNAALDMIRNKNRKLSEIAEACGFSNYNHFSKEFKKAFGMSPSEYQKYTLKMEVNKNEELFKNN